jgi:hypothetical protein
VEAGAEVGDEDAGVGEGSGEDLEILRLVAAIALASKFAMGHMELSIIHRAIRACAGNEGLECSKPFRRSCCAEPPRQALQQRANSSADSSKLVMIAWRDFISWQNDANSTHLSLELL